MININKSKKSKKIVWIVILALILECILTVGIYISDYYEAKEYDISSVDVEKHKDYIIYGDTKSEIGIIFYPGGKVEATAYTPILVKLAENDICCVLVDMPFNLAVFNSNAAKDVINDIPDIDTWYISGHSLGGAMAASFAADNEDKLDGVILLAAYPTKEIHDIPVLSIYGSNDGVLNMDKYIASKSNAFKYTEVVIDGGNHAYFGNYGEQEGDNIAEIDSDEQWQQTVDSINEFILNTENQ